MPKRKPNPYLTDADNPALTRDDFVRMRPAFEVLPELKRGRPKLAQPKVAVSLRLDSDIAERLRASGEGWQTRVNELLRAALAVK
jgi:uncharacterized protein (DUF4415 family)